MVPEVVLLVGMLLKTAVVVRVYQQVRTVPELFGVVTLAPKPKVFVVARRKVVRMGRVTAPAVVGMGTATVMILAGMTVVTPPRPAVTGTVLANQDGMKEFVKVDTVLLTTVPATGVTRLTITRVCARGRGVTGPRGRTIPVLMPAV